MKEDLKKELEELEQDELNERLSGAERAPIHMPAGSRVEGLLYLSLSMYTSDAGLFVGNRSHVAVEDDDEAQLRELQASLAM